MKIVIELKNTPKKGDVLVFLDAENVECISQNKFFKTLTNRIKSVENSVSALDERVTALEEDVSVLKGEDEQ